MKITEVQIKLETKPNTKVLAYATVVLDSEFAIHDIKLLQGPDEKFIAMPSRTIADHCPGCNGKNILRAKFCNWCAKPLNPERGPVDEYGQRVLFCDVAHPIVWPFRQLMESAIIAEYAKTKASNTAGERDGI